MSDYHAQIGDILMKGLAPFIPPKNPEKAPEEYARVVFQYVEALEEIRATPEALERALKSIRMTRKDRFWPLVAELVEDVKTKMWVIAKEREPPRALPAPAPPQEFSAKERAVASRAMALLGAHMEAGTLSKTNSTQLWNQAVREIEGEKAA